MKSIATPLTLLVCTVTTFLSIIIRYSWNGGNPSHRIGFAIFFSLVPAIASFILLKLFRPTSSWRSAGAVFVALLAAALVIQVWARTLG